MKIRYEQVEKHRPKLREQARKHDPDYLARLSASLAKAQLQPIGMLPDDIVIWGNARVLASHLNPAITHLTAAIFQEEISEKEFQRLRFIENQCRQDLTNAEKCQNCVEFAKNEPSMTLKQIAKELDCDPSMVTRWLAWEKIIEPARQALDANTITLVQMYDLSKLSQEEQGTALEAILSGGRKPRGSGNGNGHTSQRSKLFLPCGMEFTVAASEMSLQGLRDGLRDLGKLVEEAKDIETLAEAMKVAKSEGVTDLEVIAKALKSAKENDQELDLRTLLTVAKGKKKGK